jgi:membrane-associated protease RseP (regulator of RpoE activity)
MRNYILTSILFFSLLQTKANNPGYLGVLVQDYSGKDLTGVLIKNVFDDGAAKQYGIKENDIILAINGKKISQKSELIKEIETRSWGDLTIIDLVSNNINKKLNVYLGYKGTTRTYSVKKTIEGEIENWKFTDDKTDITVKPDNTPIAISKINEFGIKDIWTIGSKYRLEEVPQYFLDIDDKVACIKRIKEDQAKRNCKINDIIYIKEVSNKIDNQSQGPEELPLVLNDFSVFPNPSNGVFTVKINTTENGKSKFSIFNILGKTIQTNDILDFSGEYSFTYNLSSEPKGAYLLQFKLGDRQITKRILIQ